VGELIGELNNSHTYIWGGDPGVSFPRVPVGLLGADVAREGDAYRVTRIYRGDAADVIVAPLAAPGVGVSEGEYILAVNHERFEAGRSFHSYFDALAGKPVVLTVNSRPAMEGARDVVVTPTGSEGVLRYTDWVRRNREYVAEKTGGKIGYIHIPDMGTDGLIEFNTWFYPQLDKEGMIVDARWNGGGSVSQMIMERLRRSVTAFGRARGGSVYTYPDRVLNGPFVVLTNEFAGSDGDIFPAAIQLEKLAPVIGKRSWGGVVGIRGDKALVDGGMVTQPEFSWWDSKGGWSIENHGVDPDIVVENLPQDVAAGKDPQLDRAISEVLKLHAQEPPSRPVFGSVRNRTREAFGKELLEQR
jgi:tricorn protease